MRKDKKTICWWWFAEQISLDVMRNLSITNLLRHEKWVEQGSEIKFIFTFLQFLSTPLRHPGENILFCSENCVDLPDIVLKYRQLIFKNESSKVVGFICKKGVDDIEYLLGEEHHFVAVSFRTDPATGERLVLVEPLETFNLTCLLVPHLFAYKLSVFYFKSGFRKTLFFQNQSIQESCGDINVSHYFKV